ncbi:hypothetical protein [Nocardia sp. NPDC020380]|uniref:hypothetical protein n=1 Tax=Nocardia sp. NPDC020380 TaxID=3364309 RepID=UPI0037B5C2BF
MTTGNEGPLTRVTIRYIRRLIEEAGLGVCEPTATHTERGELRTKARETRSTAIVSVFSSKAE